MMMMVVVLDFHLNIGLYGKLSLAGDIESSGQVNTDDVYDQ
jgi:hypothetical protein